MIITISGFSFTFLSIIFFYYFWNCQRILKEEKSEFARFISFLGLFLGLSFSGIGLAGIFASQNQQILQIALFFTVLFQTIAFSFVGALFFHLKGRSSGYGFLLIFLPGLVPVFLELFFPPSPQLTTLGFINWHIQTAPGISRAILIFLTIFPLGSSFFTQLKKTTGILFWKTLIIGFSFVLAGFFGIIIVIARTLLQMIVGELGLVFSTIILFTASFLRGPGQKEQFTKGQTK